jgi:hypothetical protein
MTLVLLVATVYIEATYDADVINAHRYCAHSKLKHHTSSLNSCVCLFGMVVEDSI